MARGMLVALAGLLAFPATSLAQPRAGELDDSFGGDGVVFTRVKGHTAEARSVAIGRKHRVVVAGTAADRFALARLKPNGRLDRSFSGDGTVSTGFAKNDAFGHAVAIGRKGSIVAAGKACRRYGPCYFAVAKYRSDGHLDRSFAGDGARKVGFPGRMDNYANAVAIDARGRVILGGTSCAGSDCRFALVRLTPHGNLDQSFGDRGRVITQFEAKSGYPVGSYAFAMASESHGRILLAGRVTDAERVALARYGPKGHLDPAFGTGGTVTMALRKLRAIRSIAIAAKDKIVAVGPGNGRPMGWGVARFLDSGRIDDAFGDRGQVSTRFGNKRVAADAVAIDSRNRIVVGGGPRFNLARYQPNGHLNRSFGHSGKITKDFGFGGLTSVAIDSQNRPVAAGFAKGRFAVARFTG